MATIAWWAAPRKLDLWIQLLVVMGLVVPLAPILYREAYQPLADDVREHAMAAALQDPRFPPVQPGELNGIRIEVSRLTEPVELEYSTAEELLVKLRPHVDGVILRDGFRRATFLPQVWEKIPDPADFLDNLCYKMGAEAGVWRRKHLTIQIYQVEEFHE